MNITEKMRNIRIKEPVVLEDRKTDCVYNRSTRRRIQGTAKTHTRDLGFVKSRKAYNAETPTSSL